MARLLSLPSPGGITWENFPCLARWDLGLALLPSSHCGLEISSRGSFHDLNHNKNNNLNFILNHLTQRKHVKILFIII